MIFSPIGISAKTDFLISDGFELYLRLKGVAKTDNFRKCTKRNERYLIACLGNVAIGNLSPRDGADFREHLLAKGLSSASVHRVFSTVKAVINLCISEQGLHLSNPFGGVFIPQDDLESKRQPIPLADIRNVQAECYGWSTLVNSLD